KYNNAFNSFELIKTGIYNRVSGYFDDVVNDSICFSGLFLNSRNITDNEVGGEVSYQYEYNTDNRYIGNGIYSFFSSGYENILPVHLKSDVPILNDINSSYAISNFRSNSALGSYTFS